MKYAVIQIKLKRTFKYCIIYSKKSTLTYSNIVNSFSKSNHSDALVDEMIGERGSSTLRQFREERDFSCPAIHFD